MNAWVGGRGVDPNGRSVAAVAGAVALFTVLVFAIPPVHFGYPFPGLAHFVATIVGASGLVLAILFFLRHRRTRSSRDLIAFVAFALVTVLEAVLPIVAYIEPASATVVLWSRVLGRLVVAIAFCLAAWLPDRRLRRRVSASVAITVAVVTSLLVVGFILLRLATLPEAISGVFDAPSQTALMRSPTGVVLRVLGALLFATAALGFARARARNPVDGIAGWLAITAVLMSAARVNDFLFPSRYTDWLTTGDSLHAVAQVVLVCGAVYELVLLARQRVDEAGADERRRVARELHDGVAQELAFLTTNFMMVAGRLEPSDPLHELAASAERALHETRAAITALADNDRLRLDRLVADAGQELERRHGYPVALDLSEVVIDERRGHELTRVASEALTNAARHGNPDRISVRLRGSRRAVSLCITDDGRGLDVRDVATQGYGMTSMRERVERLGGTCWIGPAASGGTEVLVEVPRS